MKVVLSIVLNEFTHDNRVLNEAITLTQAGYNIKVIALHKEQLSEVDNIQGVKVHRIKLRSINLKRFKIIKHLEYLYQTFKKYSNSKVDILHCHDLTALPVGFLFKVFVSKSIKVVYDAHEYETEMNGLGKMRKFMYKILEKLLIPYADSVITVSDFIGLEYQRLYNISKPVIIFNCPWKRTSTQNFNLFREKFNISPNQLIFLYQGIVGKGRGVEILLETFAMRKSKDVVVVFMGFGPLEKEIIEYANKYDNIFFQEAIKPPHFLDYTSSADYGVAFIEDISLSDRYCLPNKLFEYLNAGIPVLCSNLPEMKKFVNENGVGIVSNENTSEGLMNAIKKSLDMDIHSVKKRVSEVSEEYCWEAQGEKLLKLYKSFT